MSFEKRLGNSGAVNVSALGWLASEGSKLAVPEALATRASARHGAVPRNSQLGVASFLAKSRSRAFFVLCVWGLPIAHPNSIYLAFACFGLANEKPSPLPKIMFFFLPCFTSDLYRTMW
jgi:hypothetical protein